jgi:4-hydroxybenzoate polyprenyltransferase
MVQFLINLFHSARPRQTLKNLALAGPLIFSGKLLDAGLFWLTVKCIFIFSILTASIYFFNDVLDIARDRLHPVKKKRPIASGQISVPLALLVFIVGSFVSLYLAYLVNFFFFLACLTYFGLQISYSLVLKRIALIDILAIASGFIIRVYAGALAINVHMNVWFLLCVISLALFLAAGKRRTELAILEQTAARHRKTLTFYTPALLDSYLSMFANSAWLAYALFTFFAAPPFVRQRINFFTNLPLTFSGINKWLMITIPVVIFGIMRYLKIVHEGTLAESPEKVLLADKTLLATISIWIFLVVFVLYGVSP